MSLPIVEGAGLAAQEASYMDKQMQESILQSRRNTKLTLKFQAGSRIEDIIDRMFHVGYNKKSPQKRALQRGMTKDQTSLEADCFMNIEDAYSIEPRRKLYSKNTQKDEHYLKKLVNFQSSKVAILGKGAFIGDQELYYNVEAHKMYVCDKPSLLIYIPKAFYYQMFIQQKKAYFSDINKSLLLKNSLFGNLGLNLEMVAYLFASYSLVTLRRGERLLKTRNKGSSCSFFYILISGIVKVHLDKVTSQQTLMEGHEALTAKEDNDLGPLQIYRRKVIDKKPKTYLLLEPHSVIFLEELLKTEEDPCDPLVEDLLFTAETVEATLIKIPAWIMTEYVRTSAELKDRAEFLHNQFLGQIKGNFQKPLIFCGPLSRPDKVTARPKGLLKAKCTNSSDPVPNIDLVVENINLLNSLRRSDSSKDRLNRSKVYSMKVRTDARTVNCLKNFSFSTIWQIEANQKSNFGNLSEGSESLKAWISTRVYE